MAAVLSRRSSAQEIVIRSLFPLWFLVFSFFLLFSNSGWSIEGGPYRSVEPGSGKTQQGGESAYRDLFEKARTDGGVRIIVGLKASFVPEGRIAARRDVDRQRAEISRLQNSLHHSLSGHKVTGVRKFGYIPFMALEVDEAALSALASNPMVSGIEEDLPAPPSLLQSTPLIGADAAWSSGYTGLGWTIAVLDSGLDTSHSFFAGKVVAEACYSTTSALLGSTSLCPNGQSSQVGSGAGMNCPLTLDTCDHGTHVAGIAAGRGSGLSGVAQDVTIISIQVFSKIHRAATCGSAPAPCVLAYTSDMIEALMHVYELRNTYNIAAVNISLGFGNHASHCDSEAGSRSVKVAIDTLRAVGIPTIAAAGNESTLASANGLNSPACISSAISVGATTKTDAVAAYSNSSSILSLLAPGSRITSSVPGNSFDDKSGTSMAAPHVTGAWAILKRRKPSATVDEILSALRTTGVAITDARNGIAKPRIRVDAALDALPADCAASSSGNLTVFVPVLAFNGASYWVDLQYIPESAETLFRLTDFGQLSDSSPFAGCNAATLSSFSPFVLHVPDLRIGDASYRVDLEYMGGSPDIFLKLISYSQNTP